MVARWGWGQVLSVQRSRGRRCLHSSPGPSTALEARAASLLPGLFLARVDGKSPVEYITREKERERVRRVARPLLLAPPARLQTVRSAWAIEVGA